MDNQEIVFVDRSKNVVIIQSKAISYLDTLENFAIDYGSEIPSYIQKLDMCKDTNLKILNGAIIKYGTPNGNKAITYVDTLISAVENLQKNKELRENPIYEPTEEELELQTKQEELRQKEVDLEKIDKQLFNLMCEDFANRQIGCKMYKLYLKQKKKSFLYLIRKTLL